MGKSSIRYYNECDRMANAMRLLDLRSGRQQRRWSQKQAAARLGLSQPYLSMLETGKRQLPARLARKVTRVYCLPPTALPPSQPTFAPATTDPRALAEQLAALGYPGLAYLGARRRRKNPGEVLLTALAQPNLEPRLVEALPWLLLHHWDADADWLVSQAKLYDLQNRLGFVVCLAARVSRRATPPDASRDRALGELEVRLACSRLAREDTLCQASLSEAERQWLRQNRSEEAKDWNLLTDWRAEVVRYDA